MEWYLRIFIVLFVVLIVPSIAAVYKWVDENGVVHYSDKPSENKNQAQMIIHSPSPSEESINKAPQILKMQLDEQKKLEQSRSINERNTRKVEEGTQQHLSQLIKSCGRARQELRTLQEGRAFRYGENDERVFLDDETVKAEVNRLNAFIETNCNSSPKDLNLQQIEAEKFSKQQNIEDQCVFARQKLMLEDKPEAHTTFSELEETKQNVDRWCKNATGDRTIVLRRNFIRVR